MATTIDDWSSITDTHAVTAAFGSNKALYGRSKERLALLKTYQRLLQTKEAQTVIVHGESRTGKTALVNV
jgi:hypothetical protein